MSLQYLYSTVFLYTTVSGIICGYFSRKSLLSMNYLKQCNNQRLLRRVIPESLVAQPDAQLALL